MARRVLLAATLAAVLFETSASSFYPVDHWTYVKKLTTDNFDEEIKTAVDSGKTMFVRWIASEG